MKKLFVGSTILIFLFTLCIIAIRYFNPHHDTPAHRIFGTNSSALDQACWQNICPGKTSIAASVASLNTIATQNRTTVTYAASSNSNSFVAWYTACIEFSSPDWQSCVLPYYGVEDSELQIQLDLNDSGLYLGDVVAILGSPDSIFMCFGFVPDYSSLHSQDGVAVVMYYANGAVVLAYKFSKYNPPLNPTSRDEWVASPDMLVSSIHLNPATPLTVQADGELLFPWRGFTHGPERRYNCGP